MLCDVANVVNADLWFRTGFLSQADMLAANWLTVAELYQYADDAAQSLARATALFLTHDASVAVTAGTAVYTLPAGHIFTESAWLVDTSSTVQLLRLTGDGQLFALDGRWATKTGTPTRLSLDAVNARTAALYPAPVANATLNLIAEIAPPAVAAGSSVLPVSDVLEMYFSTAIVAGVLARESDHAKPEVAAHLVERLKLLDEVVKSLWGSGR
jgi:hypothetical protein